MCDFYYLLNGKYISNSDFHLTFQKYPSIRIWRISAVYPERSVNLHRFLVQSILTIKISKPIR